MKVWSVTSMWGIKSKGGGQASEFIIYQVWLPLSVMNKLHWLLFDKQRFSRVTTLDAEMHRLSYVDGAISKDNDNPLPEYVFACWCLFSAPWDALVFVMTWMTKHICVHDQDFIHLQDRSTEDKNSQLQLNLSSRT